VRYFAASSRATVPHIHTQCASQSASCAAVVVSSRRARTQTKRLDSAIYCIEECLDEELHRYVRTAKLFDVGRVLPDRTLPELLDVRLMAMSPHAFTPTGFERVDSVEYAQSWLVSERE